MKKFLLIFILSLNCFATVVPERDAAGLIVSTNNAFASKSNHFFRGHGVECTAAASTSTNCDFSLPYAAAKFNGAEVINGQAGDYVNFKVVDSATGTYSGTNNALLNQFGFNWYLKSSEPTKEVLPYVSDIYQGMVLRVEYHNNSAQSRTIYVNFYVHENK